MKCALRAAANSQTNLNVINRKVTILNFQQSDCSYEKQYESMEKKVTEQKY